MGVIRYTEEERIARRKESQKKYDQKNKEKKVVYKREWLAQMKIENPERYAARLKKNKQWREQTGYDKEYAARPEVKAKAPERIKKQHERRKETGYYKEYHSRSDVKQRRSI